MIKTVTLKTAKLLKEAGYPQGDGYEMGSKKKSTHFAWVEEWHWDGKTHDGKSWTEGKVRLDTYWNNQNPKLIAVAPTAEEMLERLPGEIVANDGNIYILHIEKINFLTWGIKYITDFPDRTENKALNREWDKSLAEAAGKIWLYLKKEGLL